MNIPSKLKAATVKAILKHAEVEYPKECCGVVVVTPDNKEKYVPCVNSSNDPTEEFKMTPESFSAAEDLGDIVGIVHSHPDSTSTPSAHDLAIMSVNREIELSINPDSKPIPWHIVSWPEGDYRQVIPQVHQSLLGRQFVHSVWDCWQTCNDYYKKYHNIEFQKFEREDKWWEKQENKSLYEDYYKEAGFYQVSEPQVGDMIVMQIGRSFHPNHAGIYLGKIEEFEDVKVAGNGPFLLHHMYGRKSEVIVYGGQWSQRTRLILRHKGVK